MMQFGDDTQTHDLARENETLRAEIERLTEEVNALRLVATAHDAEVERLREEVATWRSRYEAERKDHHESLKAWDEERSGL